MELRYKDSLLLGGFGNVHQASCTLQIFALVKHLANAQHVCQVLLIQETDQEQPKYTLKTTLPTQLTQPTPRKEAVHLRSAESHILLQETTEVVDELLVVHSIVPAIEKDLL